MNPNKPLNPSVSTNDFSGQSVASGLDAFAGAAGGTGYGLKASGLPWIQFVRVQPGAGAYTVIDAIAAVNPVVVGDALSVAPDNLASGVATLHFQKPADTSQTLVSVAFDALSDLARVSTVGLTEFSAFAPISGTPSSAYQLAVKPVTGTNAVSFVADISLRAGENYAGSGDDLRVFEWSGTHWTSLPFVFNPTSHEVLLAGVTNVSAFVVSQFNPPGLAIQAVTNGVAFHFVPVPNCSETLERSTDLVTWTPVSSITTSNAQPLVLSDTNAPAGKAFYRLVLNLP